ncbi:MAG: hypothetical protein AB203_03635 [Parcubacteria bacterium C7867-008]|nr:MAG: hypothetical protein AB203_03635 [Parcubacteria bacterium C7867-008]
MVSPDQQKQGICQMANQKLSPGVTRADAKRETRNKVLSAARKLFSERPYEGTTIRDVVATCGMSTGAVFNSFGGKEEVFVVISKDDLLEYDSVARSLDASQLSPSETIISILSIDYESARLNILRSQLSCAYAGSEAVMNLVNERIAEAVRVLEEFATVSPSIGGAILSIHCDLCRPVPYTSDMPGLMRQELSARLSPLFG